jgi:soluble lytic murein transglycosylase-like protein
VYAQTLQGMRLLEDGPRTSSITLAVTRSVLRTNPRLAPVDALLLAGAAVSAARDNHLPPEFFAAALLQESAFDPQAISSAGAVGIAQFMPSTAAAVGVDPYDPYEAIRGAAALLGTYVAAYRGVYADPYTAALAAYNAGPQAVSAYKGIPPYPETQAYIADIADRWARITGDER